MELCSKLIGGHASSSFFFLAELGMRYIELEWPFRRTTTWSIHFMLETSSPSWKSALHRPARPFSLSLCLSSSFSRTNFARPSLVQILCMAAQNSRRPCRPNRFIPQSFYFVMNLFMHSQILRRRARCARAHITPKCIRSEFTDFRFVSLYTRTEDHDFELEIFYE